VKQGYRQRVEEEEKMQRVVKRVKGLWRRTVVRPWKKVFGRRDSWIGTFYLR